MSSEKKQLHRIVSKVLSKKINKSESYKFGIQYFGPFLYGYINWLYYFIKKGNYNKIFFFSRDGYMMEKAFNILVKDTSIETKYVYFSRKSIRQALLHYCTTYETSLRYITKERFVSLGKLLEYYGYSMEEKEKITERYNLNLDKKYLYSDLINNKFLKRLYYSLKEEIDKKSFVQDRLLLSYMEQIELNGKCAIVDIGWHGSMQFYLEKFAEFHNINLSLNGFYVGIAPMFPLKGSVNGYLYDKKDLKFRKSILCFHGGYEKLFQSCEGSTCGYIQNEKGVFPVIADYEYCGETKAISCINEWQEGALFFVEKVKDKKIKFIDDKEWAYPLIEFGKNPSLKDIKLFSFFYNSDGVQSYFVSQKPLRKYKLNEFIYELSNSSWKTGFMKSVFKLPLPYYGIYSLIRK